MSQCDTKHIYLFILNVILFICLYIRFLLVIYFIHISVYMSIPISQFIPPPPPPPPRHFPPLVSIHLFSTSVSLFLPCKPVHLYHFSRFHIYALVYDITHLLIVLNIFSFSVKGNLCSVINISVSYLEMNWIFNELPSLNLI